ncbi:HDOD domain-containing protein [Chitinibacter tainanensis]|uniref:HDOD domain-containing protein n=1 Tax=Chitinibacter tainanensis TaxID=230667 RepID=UPI002356ABF8|nr:HDOD domain-containing protein [Chitinibacter tainanensis]
MATVAAATSAWFAKPLPIMQASRNQIAGMAKRADRVKPAELSDVVLQDPLFTAQLLRLVNDRVKGGLTADIASVESAILLVGVEPFLERFSRHATLESVLLPDGQQEYALLQKWVFHAQLLRRVARDLADQRYDAKVHEVQAAALLLTLRAILPLMAKVLDPQHSQQAVDIPALLQHWQFPPVVIELVGEMTAPTPRYVLFKAMIPVLEKLESGWWDPDIQSQLATMATVLGQEIGEVWNTLCKCIVRQTRRLPANAPFYSSARWLVMQPGEWPQAAQAAAPASAEQGKDILVERMQALHLAGLQGAPTNQVMSLAIRALAEGLGLRRIAFALFVAAENNLRMRYVQGEHTEGLRQLVIPLQEQHLFTRLLQKPASIWLNSGNLAQYVPLLPIQFSEQLGADQFVAMSIFVSDKPVGLLYADAGGNQPVSDFQYQHFKQISTLTSRALAHNARRRHTA